MEKFGVRAAVDDGEFPVFGSRIALKPLSIMCRSLATMLHAGVPLLKAIRTVATRTGGPGFQSRLQRVCRLLEQGEDVEAAFRSEGDYYPDLFVDMVAVAEQTGTLPEVLKSLANHYENLIRLRRSFVGQIAMPVLQLIAAIFIITFVIYVLGMIAESRGTQAIDVFGLGLVGARGAAIFFFGCFGTLFGLFFLYFMLARSLPTQRMLHGVFLQIPVVGQCMRAFAIARFSWAFALTQQSGMDILPSLKASLKATSNGAFIAATPRLCGLVQQGEDLSTAMYDSGLFPAEYMEMVRVAETSGTVPEMLDHLSPQFEDSANRSLAMLAKALGWMVWALVAGFIIFAIFKLASFYLGALNQAANF